MVVCTGIEEGDEATFLLSRARVLSHFLLVNFSHDFAFTDGYVVIQPASSNLRFMHAQLIVQNDNEFLLLGQCNREKGIYVHYVSLPSFIVIVTDLQCLGR